MISLWLVLLIVFLDWVGIGLVYPMFSSMLFNVEFPLLDLNTSQEMRGAYLGVLLAAMPIAQFISGPALGALSDQKGRRPLFILSLCLAIGAYAISTIGVLAGSIWILIASRLLTGIAAGNSSVVSAAIADLSTAENKAKHFGLYSAACGVGFTVGPFLGGILSETSFALPFIVAGLATLFNLILLYYFFKETHIHRTETKLQIGKGIRNLKKAFEAPSLRAIFLTILIFCFGWSFFFEFIPVTWIYDYDFDPGQIGFFFAYGAGFYALSSAVLIRPIVKRFNNRSIFFYTLILLGIVFLSLLSSPGVAWVWVYMPIINFLVALIFPTSTTMVSDWAGKDTQGETLGILASVQAAAFAISPLAAGSILCLHPHMPMFLGGISMLLAALILGVMLRKEIFSK